MARVLQLLSWEPDSVNRWVVITLVRKGEAAGEQETLRGVHLKDCGTFPVSYESSVFILSSTRIMDSLPTLKSQLLEHG